MCTHFFNTSRAGDSTIFPWDPVPMLNHSFSEETFPNVQHELSLAQLEVIFLCSIASCLGEEENSQLTTTQILFYTGQQCQLLFSSQFLKGQTVQGEWKGRTLDQKVFSTQYRLKSATHHYGVLVFRHLIIGTLYAFVGPEPNPVLLSQNKRKQTRMKTIHLKRYVISIPTLILCYLNPQLQGCIYETVISWVVGITNRLYPPASPSNAEVLEKESCSAFPHRRIPVH